MKRAFVDPELKVWNISIDDTLMASGNVDDGCVDEDGNIKLPNFDF